MKCQNCRINNATTHYSQYVNGETTELYLCTECASKLGVGGVFSGFDPFVGLFSAFSSMPAQTSLPARAKKCGVCGLYLRDIVDSGRVGCAHCYETFRAQLAPSIERLHGKAAHCGKRPGKAAQKEISKESELEQLRRQLKEAIDSQEYEQAAVYRDRIRALENE